MTFQGIVATIGVALIILGVGGSIICASARRHTWAVLGVAAVFLGLALFGLALLLDRDWVVGSLCVIMGLFLADRSLGAWKNAGEEAAFHASQAEAAARTDNGDHDDQDDSHDQHDQDKPPTG